MGLEYKWNLGHIPNGADGEHENMERMLWDLHWLLKHMFPGLLELEVGSVMLISRLIVMRTRRMTMTHPGGYSPTYSCSYLGDTNSAFKRPSLVLRTENNTRKHEKYVLKCIPPR